jgi:hypothetical protein
MWSITQPVAGIVDWLGHIEAREGRGTGISKGFSMTEPKRLQLGVHAGFVS